MSPPERPSGIAAAHAERRAKRDREVASEFSPVPAPAPPPAPPPIRRPEPQGVRTVVTRTRSGAVLTSYVGREPRTDVETPRPGERRAEVDRERLLTANIRHNRRVRHLLGPDLG